ncbi:MAG: hypothetical protein SFZ02_11410 [bacterium]|nr:hypothetical protein [bacterium]
MTIIIFLFLLLFGGCTSIANVDILPVYPDGPPHPTIVEIYPSPTYTPTDNHSRGEPSATPTLDFSSASPTPTPNANVEAVIEPCSITVRQPPVNAPTRMPDPMNSPNVGAPIDPHVAFCTTPEIPQVGQAWIIYLRAIDLGMPIYFLTLSNIEGEELTVSYNPATAQYEVGSDLSSLSFVSAMTLNSWNVVMTFMVNEPDEIRVTGSASGEVHFGYPGPAMWSTGALEPFVLTTSE